MVEGVLFGGYMFAYGCYKLGVEEYWNYRFDQLRRSGRKEFIVGGKRDRIYNICNQKEYRRLVFVKIEFIRYMIDL